MEIAKGSSLYMLHAIIGRMLMSKPIATLTKLHPLPRHNSHI